MHEGGVRISWKGCIMRQNTVIEEPEQSPSGTQNGLIYSLWGSAIFLHRFETVVIANRSVTGPFLYELSLTFLFIPENVKLDGENTLRVHMTFNVWPEMISAIIYVCQVCVKKKKKVCSTSANDACSSFAKTNSTFACKALHKRVVAHLEQPMRNTVLSALQLNNYMSMT